MVTRSLQNDPLVKALFALQNGIKRKQIPIRVRCSSLTGGEVLRISALEFYKKVMHYSSAAKQIEELVKDKISKYLTSQAVRYQHIADFNQRSLSNKYQAETEQKEKRGVNSPRKRNGRTNSELRFNSSRVRCVEDRKPSKGFHKSMARRGS